MRRVASRVAPALCLALAAPLGWAQPSVYRCGQTYQQAPCGQSGKAVDVNDARSESQRRAAQNVARDESQLAATLERDRRMREKEARPAPAAGIGVRAAPPNGAASAPTKPKHRKKSAKVGARPDEDFIAVEPGGAAKRKGGSAAR